MTDEIQNWHALSPAEKKCAVEDKIEEALAMFSAEGHESDEWEARDLLAAMGALLGRMPTLAWNMIGRALVDEHERAGTWERKDTTPTVANLRDSLAYLRGATA